MPWRRALARLALLGLPACGAGGGAPAQVTDDATYALGLLKQAGVAVERPAIRRVLRDSIETVVWVERGLKGLPVFDREVGYVFDARGGAPVTIGEPLPAVPATLNDRPRVTADQARDVFEQRAAREQWVTAPDDPLQAVLGFAVVPGRQPLVLAWRVWPVAEGAQVVVVDATDGRELSWDSGIRCARAPC